MKVTLNWLKEILNTDKLEAEEIADSLTMSGTEVKKVDRPAEKFENIVVGRIIDFKPHPNADKLSLCRVEAGDREVDIVCGADNFGKGDRVALALPGARLGKLRIKRSKIRGQVSEGMMCSEAELGLSDESEGIMILDDSLKLGQSFASAMGLDDVVFELEVTPNRPDCLSVIGIARELAALKSLELKLPDYGCRDDMAKDKKLEIAIEDYSLCPRYSAKVFYNLSQKQSPAWLKNRLKLCDIRPVDLIVDLTNYVMLETGQPLHAFDYDLLASGKIIVRPAKKGEDIRTIDDNLRKLEPGMIVIADEKGPVAIAGIMGGKDTEINEATSNVLLEAANFNGPAIMRASKKLGLRSEASNRFEKKIDPHLTLFAIKRFEGLLEDITGYSGGSGIYDNYSQKERERKLILRPQKVHQILGQDIEAERITEILSGLQIPSKTAGENIEVTVPSFRYEDLEREVDLIEEVARIYGFNRFSSKPPRIRQRAGGYSPYQKAVRDIRSCLADIGLFEVINYSFISKNTLEGFMLDGEKAGELVRIINPINEDFEYLRPSLLPAMVENVADNLKYKNQDLSLFEISRVFEKAKGKLASETSMLGILLTGRKQKKSWNRDECFYDFYDLKGILEYLVNRYWPKEDLNIKQKEFGFFHPVISGVISVGEMDMGIAGKIHPNLLERLEIGKDIYYAEINLDKFIGNIKAEKQFEPVPVYPSIDVDIAIVVDEKIGNRQIEEAIWEAGSDMLKEVRLFDLYKGKQIEEGQKSMAYSLTFREEERTLKDREVEIEVERIVSSLSKKFNARLRQ
ncbi:MAG: phenylalanine--tRNA ligase subunit beta [Actinomycetota bacterium]